MFKKKLWAVLAASAPSLGWRGGKRGEEVKPAGYAGPVSPAAGLRGRARRAAADPRRGLDLQSPPIMHQLCCVLVFAKLYTSLGKM